MGSLSELESFWQQIPQQEHKAWSQRAQVCLQLDTLASSLIPSSANLAESADDALHTGAGASMHAVLMLLLLNMQVCHSCYHIFMQSSNSLTDSCRCLQHFLIDGSPQWDIYRTVPVALEPASSLQPATAIPQPAATDSSAVLLSVDAQDATSMVGSQLLCLSPVSRYTMQHLHEPLRNVLRGGERGLYM